MGAITIRIVGLAVVAAFCALLYLGVSGTVLMNRAQVDAGIAATLDVLEQRYVYPELAMAMSRVVRASVASGNYEYVYTNFGLIEQLQEDLRSVSGDRHISLRPYRADAANGAVVARAAGNGHGITRARLLKGSIGYIRVDALPFGEEAGAALHAALRRFTGADALVIDLGNNRGGSLHQSAFLAALFLPPGTNLWTHLDRDGEVLGDHYSSRVPGAEVFRDMPLYVLTSARTFSAAEYFVWAMQRHDRATVVGERTGGGAHTIEDVPIEGLFTLRTPVGRPVIPDGERNWQAFGLEPDLAVPFGSALDATLALIER